MGMGWRSWPIERRHATDASNQRSTVGENMRIARRQLLAGGGLLAAGTITGLSRAATAQATELKKIAIPPSIGRPERLQRLARAQALMKAHDIGAIVIEPGASLDYFTGVQWWRSERLTATV